MPKLTQATFLSGSDKQNESAIILNTKRFGKESVERAINRYRERKIKSIPLKPELKTINFKGE